MSKKVAKDRDFIRKVERVTDLSFVDAMNIKSREQTNYLFKTDLGEEISITVSFGKDYYWVQADFADYMYDNNFDDERDFLSKLPLFLVKAKAKGRKSRSANSKKTAREKMSLRKKLIRLAYTQPQLRGDLLPLLIVTGKLR